MSSSSRVFRFDLSHRMRDMAAHEKHQQQRLQKDFDDRGTELNDLKKAKLSLTAQLEEQQKVIAELQEQVDAALGAEEMVKFFKHTFFCGSINKSFLFRYFFIRWNN